MSTDRFTVRLIATGLLLIAVLVVCGGFWLTDHEHTIPDALIAIGSGALGGVSTLLASTSTRHADDPPQPVNVVNEPADPVAVEEVKKK